MIDVFKKSRSFIFDKFMYLTTNRFVRNVMVVASGTAVAEVVKIAAAPVITRLYGPEPFGILGTFTALVFILTPLVALSFPISIVLPKEDHEALGLAGLSIITGIAIVILFLTLLFIWGNFIVEWLNLVVIQSFLFFIPLMLISVICIEIGQQWLFRKKQFRITSQLMVVKALMLNLAMIGAGFFYKYSSSLIIITVLVNVIYAILFILQIKNKSDGTTIQELRAKVNLYGLAKRYRDFPIYRTPQRFLNTAAQNLPVLLLASLFGPSAVAFYTLGKKVLVLPSMLIGDALSRVYYPHITELARHKRNLTRSLLKATGSLMMLGIIPFGVVIAFGPFLFGLVFGTEWVKAGEYARWLALWMYFMFLNRAVVAAIPVLSIQAFFLVYEVTSVIMRAGAISIGFFVYSDDIVAIAMFSVAGVIMNIVLIIYVISYSRNANRQGE
jgi:O-antigen/teichoic acid export membrane protein